MDGPGLSESEDPAGPGGDVAPFTRRTSDDMFRLLVDSVIDYAIFLLEPDGTIASWNSGAERIKGYSAEEIIGERFTRFYTPEDIARGHPDHELEVAAGVAGRYEDEGWRVRKDGTHFWANVVITALRDQRGTLVGFAKVTRDLTERRRNDRQLRDAASDLQRSHLELQDFSSAVAHDLRAPLQVIGGFAELLQRRHGEILTGEAGELVARIRSNVTHMNHLIEGLLTYSLAGRKELVLESVPAGEALATALAGLHDEIEASGAEVDVDVTSLPALAADRTQLVQIFQNLVGNALKFSDGPPRVSVSAERTGSSWHLRVTDQGPGVSPQDTDRIFGMFERASDRPGTGVGLATCKRIVERHGGSIWVESELEAGSTFHFTWPTA